MMNEEKSYQNFSYGQEKKAYRQKKLNFVYNDL
jgi:hypothetical protein